MSDNWITVIPEDPNFIPEVENQRRARARFAEIAPDADTIECMVHDKIEFYDCGVNLRRILCPGCHAELPVEWWQGRLAEDWNKGFMLARYKTPCCDTAHTLHELDYDWPQGFGKFTLGAMNPTMGKLKERYQAEFEEILGTKLRMIYRRT